MLLLLFSTSQGDGVVEPPAPAVEARSKGGFDPYYYKRRKKTPTPLPEEIERVAEPPLPETAREPVGIQPITLPIGPNIMAPVAAAEIAARRAYELAEQDDEDVLLLAA